MCLLRPRGRGSGHDIRFVELACMDSVWLRGHNRKRGKGSDSRVLSPSDCHRETKNEH
jgi:hypothetical protein